MTLRGIRRRLRKRLTYQRAIPLLAVLSGVPAVIVALVLVWTGDHASRTQWTVSVLVLGAWIGTLVAMRDRLVRPLPRDRVRRGHPDDSAQPRRGQQERMEHYRSMKIAYFTDNLEFSPEEAEKFWRAAQWDGSTGVAPQGDAPWAWLVNLDHTYLVDQGLDIGTTRVEPHGHGWPITANIVDWHWKEKQ